jgi:hypothetical protein
MKKILIVCIVSLISIFLAYGYSYAAVSGPCANCHTMHYSQNGGPLSTWGSSGPYDVLLVNDCLGCHTTTGSDPYDGVFPYVKSTTSGFNNDNCLAGGFFQATDSSGNNDDKAHSLGNTNAPAGFDSTETTWYTGTGDGLSCAGTNGCHGNQTDLSDMTAIKGGHHSPSVYRILYVGTNGVVGSGASDFEKALISSPSSADPHNLYSATVTGPSISELCGKCHGDFHNASGENDTISTAGAWIRHPTDQAIPSTWEIYTDFSNKWNADSWKNHPLGFDPYTTQNATTARVICVSCHRAHGTEYNDALRWNYNATQQAGGGGTIGCLGCHNRQR